MQADAPELRDLWLSNDVKMLLNKISIKNSFS